MKILLVGSGGREHALALGLQADPSCTELHCAPGNPGIAEIATLHPISITDNSAIVELAKKLAVDLVVIGPEVPLVNGVADDLRAAGLAPTIRGSSSAPVNTPVLKSCKRLTRYRGPKWSPWLSDA